MLADFLDSECLGAPGGDTDTSNRETRLFDALQDMSFQAFYTDRTKTRAPIRDLCVQGYLGFAAVICAEIAHDIGPGISWLGR